MAQAMTEAQISYEAWLSEAPRGMAPMAQIPRLMRFASAADMQAAITQGGFSAVVDASHGFDAASSRHAQAATEALGLPYLRITRAPWSLDGLANIGSVVDVVSANTRVPSGARVFCATGWDSLSDYAGFRGEVLMLRQTRRHSRPAPYPFVDLIFSDPPFTVQSEQALFQKLGVDMLICRNLGGTASRPKIDAACALGLEVLLIDPPARTGGALTVAEIEDAMDWVCGL